MKNVIVKARKINNIKSNIKYLHSIKEHPDICPLPLAFHPEVSHLSTEVLMLLLILLR